MCQVHIGTYVALLALGKPDYTDFTTQKRLPRNILNVVYLYHYACARQTQVNWRKEKKRKKKKRREEAKKRKGKQHHNTN